MRLQGIELELHSFLVSHVGEEVYKDKALLPLESLPAAFLHSCTLCAAHFAGIQEQASTACHILCHCSLCVLRWSLCPTHHASNSETRGRLASLTASRVTSPTDVLSIDCSRRLDLCIAGVGYGGLC